MRKALVLFLFLFCAARLHAQAPAFAQVSPVATFSNSQTCTATFSGSNIAGNALFFLVSSAGNTNVQNVTDQFADKYISLFGAPAIVAGGSAVLEQGQALASGPNAITATFDSVQTSTTCIAVEYSPASVVYLGLPGTAGFGTNIAQSGLGAGANNTLVNIAWAASPTATISASTSFTLRSGTGGLLVQDRANVSTGTYANGPTYPVISTSANWFSFFFSLALPAPTTTTVTGRILDLTQTPVSSGQVVFTLKPGVDTTMSGNARFTPAVVNCGISSQGLLQNINLNGPCVITMNTALIPSGTYYSVSIQPGNSPAPISGSFSMYAISSTVDISTISPTPAEMPGYNLVDIFSNQTIGGNKTFTGIVTLSGGSLLVINGPLEAVNGGTLSGNFSGNPAFTGNPTFPNGLTTLDITQALTAATVNGIYYVDGTTYTTIQQAITAAGQTGTVVIPSQYSGSTTYSSPYNIPIVDLRGPQQHMQGTYVAAHFSIGARSAAPDVNLYISASPDGVHWKSMSGGAVYLPNTVAGVGLRDPSITFANDKFWVAYTIASTAFSNAMNAFGVASSPDLVHWTHVADVDPMVAGEKVIWAPEWLKDKDGSLHLLLTVSTTNYNVPSGFAAYEIHPTDAAGLTTWSAATALSFTAGTPSGLIDLYGLLNAPVNPTGYTLLFKDVNQDYQYATASSLLGPYTVVTSGNWAGWGLGEGGSMVQVDASTWRFYFDGDVVGSYGTYFYSESTNSWATWSTPTPISQGVGWQHGTILREFDQTAERKIIAAADTPDYRLIVDSNYRVGTTPLDGSSLPALVTDRTGEGTDYVVTRDNTPAGDYLHFQGSTQNAVPTTEYNRLASTLGTALTTANFSASSGWGGGAAIGSPAGDDGLFTFSITSGSGSFSANPTVTITFEDGTWLSPPMCVISGVFAGAAPTGNWTIDTVGGSATAQVFIWNGTPGGSAVYAATVFCQGRHP